MAISAKSNRSLSRFWASVLVVMCCGFVLLPQLGSPGYHPRSRAPKTSLLSLTSLQPQAGDPTQTAVAIVRITLPPNLGMAGASASGRDQTNVALRMTQLAGLDAKIAHKANESAMLTGRKDELQSRIDDLSSKLAPTGRHFANTWGLVSEISKLAATPRTITITVHRPLHAAPYGELASMPLRVIPREGRASLEQLLSARKALVNNNSAEARDLLEAAQTSIVFEPRNTASERAVVASAQIAEALSMLNSGNAVKALPCLDRAITAVQSAF